MSATTVTERTYIGPAFADAKVYDAMRVGVVTCRPGTSLADAARIMTGYQIHCLIVADPEAGAHARSWGWSTRSMSRAPKRKDAPAPWARSPRPRWSRSTPARR